MEVGERLKTAREAAGLSQEGLHKASGVTQATISSFELGKRKPRSSTLRKLGSALGVAPEWLMGEGAEEAQDATTTLIALIEGRESGLREAMDNGKITVEMALRADGLHEDIWEFGVPRIYHGREKVAQALIELKSTINEAYHAAIKRSVLPGARVEAIHGHPQMKGGQRAEAKSA